MSQQPEDWGLARAQAQLTSSHSYPPKSWGGGSVPGNNRLTTPSGPLREKELREGNSSPRGRGHRPLSPALREFQDPLCPRPRLLGISSPQHLYWLPPYAEH